MTKSEPDRGELTFLGKRLFIQVDDLGIPAGLTVLARTVEAVACAFLCSSLTKASIQELSFVLSLTAVVVVSAIAWGITFVFAHRGNLHEHEKRAGAKPVLFGIACLYLIEVLIGMYGVVILSTSTMESSALVAFVLLWLDLSIFALFWSSVTQSNHYNTIAFMRLDEFELRAFQWQSRCRRWCRTIRCMTCSFCPKYRSNYSDFAFTQVGEVLASFFHGLSMTPTQVLVGIILVWTEQREKRAARLEDDKTTERTDEMMPSSRVLDKEEFETYWKKIQQVLPFAIGANALRTYILQQYHTGRPLVGFAKLVRNSFKNSAYQRRHPDRHHGDNCCAWNLTAFSYITSIQPSQVVYSNFTSLATEKIGYVIAVDHRTQTVILSLRATLLFDDYLTDGAMTPEHLHYAGLQWGFDGSHHYAHSGMLTVALEIREHLKKIALLEQILDMPFVSTEDVVYLDDENFKCPGYNLVVTGASLGAGVAAIETLLLRQNFPFVSGVGISTPGCIFDRELAESSSSFFTTLFVGKDVVPRSNWQSLTKLRDETVAALQRCAVNKNVVLRSLFSRKSGEELLYPSSDQISKEEVEKSQREDISVDLTSVTMTKFPVTIDLLNSIPLYCPGKLIHFAKVRVESKITRGACLSRKRTRKYRMYKAVHVVNRDDMSSILLSKNMFKDHFPNTILAAFESVASHLDDNENISIEH